jgi:chromate transporter
MREDHLIGLVLVLAPLSLASVGGATAIYAPLQHDSVEVRHWVTAKEFLDYFAMMRFMPGPSSMLGAMIGWKIEGLLGAIVATVALYLPSSLLCFAAARFWHKHRGKKWHTAVERGLVPIAAGLVCAGALALYQLSGGGLKVAAVMLGAAAILTWRKKVHPTRLLIAGAAIFEIAYLAGY